MVEQDELARAVREAVRSAGHSTPVVGAGGISDFAQAEAALANGDCDLVASARQSLADPDWFEKVRLGRGAGFYDRSLGERNARARLVAVVRDDEVLDELPAEPHDVRMTHAITPHGGLIALFCGGRAGECDTSRGGSST